MKEIIKALSKAQGAFTKAIFDKVNPHFKSKYASLEAVHECIRTPLAVNGLALSHLVKIENGVHVMQTTLFHESGESLSCEFMILGEKLSPQQFGSLLTYYRRYSICCLLALPTGVEDDDANLATPAPEKTEEKSRSSENISDEEATELQIIFSQEDAEYQENILKFFATQMKRSSIATFCGFPRKHYNSLMKSLQKRKEDKAQLSK